MQRAVDYVIRLADTPSINEKKAIIREAAVDGCIEFFKGFQLAYDKRRVFGVKKVSLIEGDFSAKELDEISMSFNWFAFERLIHKLETRQLTGHAARDAINNAAMEACINEWNHFYRPIIMKDMRCGTSDTLVNKVLKELGGDALEYLVPVWKVQLAQDSKKHPGKMVGKKAIDPKLDGMRLTAVLDKDLGTARLFSRNGKENTNFNLIIADLEKLVQRIPVSIVLDGEVVCDNFQSLMTQANRKTKIDTSDAYLALFDILPLADFEAGGCPMSQMDRHDGLVELAADLQEISGDRIYVIPKLIVDLDTEEGRDRMSEFYQETVAAGYEGIMVKDVDAPYECKRRTHWLKWKPVFEIDLKIIAVYEGEPGKRREGKLGGLTCEGYEDGKHIIVNVGGGYNDEMIVDFWDNQNKVIGEIVEIEYDAITKSKDGDHYSLRFPRFKRFRSIDGEGKI